MLESNSAHFLGIGVCESDHRSPLWDEDHHAGAKPSITPRQLAVGLAWTNPGSGCMLLHAPSIFGSSLHKVWLRAGRRRGLIALRDSIRHSHCRDRKMQMRVKARFVEAIAGWKWRKTGGCASIRTSLKLQLSLLAAVTSQTNPLLLGLDRRTSISGEGYILLKSSLFEALEEKYPVLKKPLDWLLGALIDPANTPTRTPTLYLPWHPESNPPANHHQADLLLLLTLCAVRVASFCSSAVACILPIRLLLDLVLRIILQNEGRG